MSDVKHSVLSVHQPRRAIVALVEFALAALCGCAAVWCWKNAIVVRPYSAGEHQVHLTRYIGPWVAVAVGFGTLTGLLLVDTSRQLFLAIRSGGRKTAVIHDM